MKQRMAYYCLEHAEISIVKLVQELSTALHHKTRDGSSGRELHHMVVAAEKLKKRVIKARRQHEL